MLAGAGLGDHARLPQAPREERLAEGVVDLVGTRMGEILALEVQAQRTWHAGDRVESPRLSQGRSGQAVRAIERGRPPGEMGEELAELGPEDGVVAKRGPGCLELLERRDKRLGDEAPAEVAFHAPVSASVGFDEPRVHGRRPGRRVRPIEPGCTGTLGEEGDRERILVGARAGRRTGPPVLDAGCDVDADGRDREHRLGDVGRPQATGEDNRQLAGDRRGDPGRDPRARPSGVPAARGVEEEARDTAGGQPGLALGDG